jgi:dTDP-4-dehydrorhamnose 3,5-epimerase
MWPSIFAWGRRRLGNGRAFCSRPETQNQVYIPRGFAHGFLALTERVQFLYKCSEFYDALDEHAILWSDPEIGIPWNIAAPLVSDKDRKAPTLAAIDRELLPVFGHT